MAKKSGKKDKPEKKTPKSKQTTNTFPFVCAVIALGVLIRLLQPVFNTQLTADETVLITDITNREFWGMFNPLSSVQTAPPFFLCITKLMTFLIPEGSSQQIINTICKSVPLFAGIGGIFAFHYLLKNIFINKFVVLTGLIFFAFNPSLITYSYTLKPFSTDVLICILLLTYFVRYNPEGYWRQFLQVLLLSCSILVSLPAVFVLLDGITHILFKDWRKYLFAISAFVMFFIFYFIYYLWVVMETHGAGIDNYWQSFFITKTNVSHLLLNWVKTNFNVFITPIITLGVLSVAFITTCFRDKKIAVMVATVMITILLASYLHLYPFAPGLLLFTTPLVVILVCELCDLIPTSNIVSKALPIIFTILCFYNLLTGF